MGKTKELRIKIEMHDEEKLTLEEMTRISDVAQTEYDMLWLQKKRIEKVQGL